MSNLTPRIALPKLGNEFGAERVSLFLIPKFFLARIGKRVDLS